MGLGGLGTVRVVSPRGWAHLLHCPQAPGPAQGQTGVCATRGPFAVRVEAPRRGLPGARASALTLPQGCSRFQRMAGTVLLRAFC